MTELILEPSRAEKKLLARSVALPQTVSHFGGMFSAPAVLTYFEGS
jgi:hypothetical protein